MMSIRNTELRKQLERRLTPRGTPPGSAVYTGRLEHIGPTLLKACLPGVFMGEICRILPGGMLAEVVSIDGHQVCLSPLGSSRGLCCGQWVHPLGHSHRIRVSGSVAGRIVDGFGRPLDGGPEPDGQWCDTDPVHPASIRNRFIDRSIVTGVRAIDSLLTCGEGQRTGIFAAAGLGKSTLLSMLCSSPDSDVNVLALIGERGREVSEFLQQTLSAEVMRRCTVVVATSDRPALERLRALYTATTIAEQLRASGRRVFLFVDSLTRYARAAREISLAAGEPLTSGSYPASVFASLPTLLERVGKDERGSITAFYTVLVEGDDMTEPLAGELVSLLDGHIVLSRRMAQAAHFPAIDVLSSLSRIMPAVTCERHRTLAASVRQLMSVYRDVELLIRVGEFRQGEDPLADRAVALYPHISAFLQQRSPETCSLPQLLLSMEELLNT